MVEQAEEEMPSFESYSNEAVDQNPQPLEQFRNNTLNIQVNPQFMMLEPINLSTATERSKLGPLGLKKKKPRTMSIATVALTALAKRKSSQETKPEQQKHTQVKYQEGWFGVTGHDFEINKPDEPTVIKRFDSNSCFLFQAETGFRQAVVKFTEYVWFDRFIMTIIFANSILLCLQDNNHRIYGPDYVSERDKVLNPIDDVFTILFTLEAASQIIAKGYVFHVNSYLRSPWNVLDFFVVIVSLIGFLPIGANTASFKFLRTLRVLRPLRTIKRLPKMKRLIGTLGRAMKGLLGVLFFIALIVYLFSIFGVNSFSGTTYRFCRTTLEPTIVRDSQGTLISFDWPIESTFSWLCQTDQDCADLIAVFGTDQRFELDRTPIYKCGQSIDFKVKAGGVTDIDGVSKNSRLLWNYSNFNNVPNAMLTIFQCLTMEYWADPLMYQLMSANNAYLTTGFFLGLVILGSFFLMNLFLAQMIFSFDQEVDDEENSEDSVSEVSLEKQQSELKLSKMLKSQELMLRPVVMNSLPPIINHINTLDESALVDETPDEFNARKRSYKNPIYRLFFKLVTFWGFNFFITMMILLNTVCLAADTVDQADNDILEIADIAFTWLFTTEAIFKLIGLGPKCYVADYYNLFDAAVVVLSLVDFVITTSLRDQMGANTAVLNAFRSLRLLRIIRPLKLARRWKSLHEILGKTAKAMSAIIDYVALLALFMFIFSLLGMQLFGQQTYEDLNGNIVLANELPARMQTEVLLPVHMNFNNILISINSVYCIITGQNSGWSGIMFQNLRPLGPTGWGPYSLYFVVTRYFGNQVMLTLFTAILCYSFSGSSADEEKKQKEQKEQSCMDFMRRLNFEFLYFFGYRQTVAESLRIKNSPHKKALKEDQPTRLFRTEQEDIMSDAFGIKIEPGQTSRQESQFKGSNPSSPKPAIILEEAQLSPFVEVSSPLETPVKRRRLSMRRANTEDTKKQAVILFPICEENAAGTPYPTSIATDSGTKLSPKSKKINRVHIVQPQFYHDKIEDEALLEGTSLFVFGPKNSLRLWMLQFVTNKWFERVVLLLILTSTVTLAFEEPLDDPESSKMIIFQKIDWFMTACFTFESLLKIVTYGLLFNGSCSYLRSVWNIIDFVVVVSALLALNPDSDTKKLGGLKALRTIRVLRPLRMLHRAKGLKVALSSLFMALPQIISLQLIQLFVLILLGIFFKTLFGGMFESCQYDHVRANGSLSDQQAISNIGTKWDCVNYGGEWVESSFKFDNIWESMMALYQIQTAIFDIQEVDYQPKRLARSGLIVLCIAVDVVINLLFTNLFISVVFETFKGQKTLLHDHKALQRSKLDWINMQILCYEASPQVAIVVRDEYSWHRNLCIKIVSHQYFLWFMTQNIISNTILLAISWYGMPAPIREATDKANFCFIWIFTTALILNLNAKRQHFFSVSWQNFDFFVVSSSQIVLLLNYLKIGDPGMKGIVVRTLRLGRMFRIIKNFKTIGVIFQTLTEAGPSIVSIGSLLLLVVFMYAIIGMKLFAFANVTHQTSINFYSNFKNFFNSFFLLMRAATGESQIIMYDFARTQSILFQCDSEISVKEYQEGKATNECGKPLYSFLFFSSFFIIITQLFINLIIAILVDSFIGQTQSSELVVDRDDIEQFTKVWGRIDKEALGHIRCREIDLLIKGLAGVKSEILPKDLLLSEQRTDSSPSKLEEQLKAREAYIMELASPLFHEWTRQKEDLLSVTYFELLDSMLRLKYKESFAEKNLQQEMLVTVFSQFNFKEDSLSQHQGGLSYEDRRIEILKDLMTAVKKKIHKMKNPRSSLLRYTKNDLLHKSYDGYIKMQTKINVRRYRSQNLVQQRHLPEQIQHLNDSESSIELNLFTLTEFQKKFVDQEYTTAHYIAVKKIKRCYDFIKAKHIADKNFEQLRKLNIKKRENSNETLRTLSVQRPDIMLGDNGQALVPKERLMGQEQVEIESKSADDPNEYKPWINQPDYESRAGSQKQDSSDEESKSEDQDAPEMTNNPARRSEQEAP